MPVIIARISLKYIVIDMALDNSIVKRGNIKKKFRN